MDHFLFLMQNHLDNVNVSFQGIYGRLGRNLSTLKQNSRDNISHIINGIKNREIKINYQELVQKCKHSKLSCKIMEMYNKCIFFFLTEITHTHIYFGGMCFIFGALVGFALGLKARESVVFPLRMRAVVANNYFGLESIAVVEDELAPKITSADQVLIQVKAVGIDYLDIKIAEGYGRVKRKHLNKYNPNSSGELPVVLGRNCSGVVISIGKNVTKVQQGDEVWLAVPIYHPGTLSEYIVVCEEFISLKPPQLTHEGASIFPYDVMRTWQALVKHANLGEFSTAGKRVLVHAGLSGPGMIGIQLVRAWGGHVTTTVSSMALPLVHMLGADDIITYDTTNFQKQLLLREKFDVIFNPIGPVLPESSLLEFCKPGGVIACCSDPRDPADDYGFFIGIFYTIYIKIKYLFKKNPWITGSKSSSIEISGEILDKVKSYIASGQLQPIVDKAYSAQDAEVAFHHITKGESLGKTVIRFSLSTPNRDLGIAFCQDL